MSEEDLDILPFWRDSELSQSMFEIHFLYTPFFHPWYEHILIVSQGRLSGEMLPDKEKCSTNSTSELIITDFKQFLLVLMRVLK